MCRNAVGINPDGKVVVEDENGNHETVSPRMLKRDGEFTPVEKGASVKYRDGKGEVKEGVVQEVNEMTGEVLIDDVIVRAGEIINNDELRITNGGEGSEASEPQPTGKGAFGNIYDQFRGKAKEAINFLLQKKEGEILGALSHKDIGEIDLVWGNEGTQQSDGYGLAKIAKYHPEVLENLQEILDGMQVTQRSENRVKLESDKYQASVRLEWDDQKKTWLLTAFEKKNAASDSRTDIDRTGNGKQNDTATLQNGISETDKVSGDKGTEEKSELQEKGEKSEKNEVERILASAPKRKDGKVDYDALFERSPEDYATVMEQRIGVEETKAELQADSQTIQEKIGNLKEKLSKETSRNKKEDLRDEITTLKNRKNTIDGIIQSRYAEQTEEITKDELRITNEVEGSEASEPQPTGKGVFGNIYDQFKGKAKEAIDFLMKKKEGEALGALHHSDIGDFSLVWGNDKAGLEKIAQKHPEVLDDLQEKIDKMKVVASSENRIVLESENYKAVVSKKLGDKETNQWLLSAYEKKNGTASVNISDNETEPEGKGIDTATPQSNTVSDGKGTEKKEKSQEKVEKSAKEALRSLEAGMKDESDPYAGMSEEEVREASEYRRRIADAESDVEASPAEGQKDADPATETGDMFRQEDAGSVPFHAGGRAKRVSREEFDRVVARLKERFPGVGFHLFSGRNPGKAIVDLLGKSGTRVFSEVAELSKVNAKWNKELAGVKDGTHKGVLHLGKPLEILQAAGIKSEGIELAPEVLEKKLKQHNLTTDDLQNLAESIQTPIMVYEWGTKAKSTVIVTELTTKDGRKITVALRSENKGKKLEVNEVASIHGKAAERFLSEMENAKEGGLETALRWVEKEKALNWLGLSTLSANEGLNSAAKVIQNFENPKVSEEKINGDIRFMATSKGEVYGFTDGKDVYIDEDLLNLNTPIHECGHLLWRVMPEETRREITELLKGTPGWKRHGRNAAYAGLKTDDAKADELFNTLLGNYGEYNAKVREIAGEDITLYARIQNALNDFLTWLKARMGNTDARLNEFAKRSLGELLGEKTGELRVGEKQKALESAKRVSDFIMDVLNGKVKNGKQTIELPEQANRLAEKALGHPIESHSIRADEVRHIKKGHGETGEKLQTNSIPLRDEDIALLPYIMGAPDRVIKGTPTRDGAESVRYIKELSNGRIVVVERKISPDSHNMENITMWADTYRLTTAASANLKGTSATTSETHNAESDKNHSVNVSIANLISQNDAAKIRKDFETAVEKENNLRFSMSTGGYYLPESENEFENRMQYISEKTGIKLAKPQFNKLAKLLMAFGLVKDVVTDKAKYAENLKKAIEETFGKEKAAQFMKVWHGTGVKFDKFLDGFYLSGEGNMVFGAGFYFTGKKEIAEFYADKESKKQNKSGYVLQVKIHGDKTADELNFIDWGKPLTAKQRDLIKAELSRRGIDIDDYDYMNGIGYSIDDEELKGKTIYSLLERYFDYDVDASEFLLAAGIDGIRYPANKGQSDSFNYVVFDANAIEITKHIKFMEDKSGKVLGFIRDGVAYFDIDNLNANTAVHEFAHPFMDFIQKNHNELWKRGVALAKQCSLWDKIKNNPFYAHLKTDDEIANEVLTTLVGDKGEQVYHEKGIGTKLRDWVKEVWQLIGNKFGLFGMTSEQIQNMTLEQFINGATAHVMSGKPVTTVYDRLSGQKNNLEKSKKNTTDFEDGEVSFMYSGFQSGIDEDGIYELLEQNTEYTNEPHDVLQRLEEYYGGKVVAGSNGAKHALDNGLIPFGGNKYSGENEEYHHLRFADEDGNEWVEAVPFETPQKDTDGRLVISGGGVRFMAVPVDRGGSGGEVPAVDAEVVRQELNEKLHRTILKFNPTAWHEHWIDKDIPVKIFFDKLRQLGVKISSANDYYQNVTHVTGMNDTENEHFRKTFGARMLEAVSGVMSPVKGLREKRSAREVTNYMMLKHGLERNEGMREKAVREITNDELRITNGGEVREAVKLTEQQAADLVLAMEQGAEAAPEIELTPESWYKEFGEDGMVETPVGKVKMGENQYLKLQSKNRGAQFGMVKPTLENPDIVIEKYDPGDGSERDTKLLFIKTFTDKNGNKHIFFESITVKKDGLEVSISSHIADKKAIANELINGTIAYNKFANRSERYLPENQNGLPDIVPAQANVFGGKGTEEKPDLQEDGAKKREKKIAKIRERDYSGIKAIVWELENGVPGFFENAKEAMRRGGAKVASMAGIGVEGEKEMNARKKAIADMDMAYAEKAARDYIEKFEQESKADEIDDLWKATRNATRYSLNKLVQGSVLSRKQAEEIGGMYEYYIPLRGHDERTAEDVNDYIGQMGTYYTDPVKSAKGRVSRADDPLAYIYQMAHSAISTANMNRLKLGLLRIADGQDLVCSFCI